MLSTNTMLPYRSQRDKSWTRIEGDWGQETHPEINAGLDQNQYMWRYTLEKRNGVYFSVPLTGNWWQYNVALKSLSSRNRLFGYKSWLHYLLSVCPWESYLLSPHFSFFIFNMGPSISNGLLYSLKEFKGQWCLEPSKPQWMLLIVIIITFITINVWK